VQCGQLYRPDRRNAHHQRFCSDPACQAASRAASRRRWLNKPENRGYHRGAQQCERVRAWRQAHPGYGRRGRTLQDLCSSQPVDSQRVECELTPPSSDKGQPLQDLWLAQDPLFVGLTAKLTGALQEDIGLIIENLQAYGRTLLGKGPGIANQGGRYGTKACPV
jgi:hypothetical protein